MTLCELTATARPEGSQIELTWQQHDQRAVRVVRRLLSYPETADPGRWSPSVVVADSNPAISARARLEILADGHYRVIDTGLLAETVYYYQVFPYTGTPPSYETLPAHRVSAMATGSYDFAGLLYRLLPTIYHRYDTAGQLQRLLELPGGQLDQIYSAVRSLRDLVDLRRVDGRLLPLLAHWIGWRTDHFADLERQRAEIRNAPQLYRAIGTVAAVEATVLRITGWSSRIKEFVDNVALTNSPERLNLWLARNVGGSWRVEDEPLSLDDAYRGRPAVVQEAVGLRLYYATRNAGYHNVWQKGFTTVEGWSGSEPAVSRLGMDQDPAAAIQSGVFWLFWSAYDDTAHRWRIDFRTQEDGRWSAIETLRAGSDDTTERQVPAVLVDDTNALWLFWLERSGTGWKLRYNCFTGQPWVPTVVAAKDFPDDGGADPRVESSVSVLFRPRQPGDPAAAFRRIWVLWSRRERVRGAPEQTRWRVVSRFKNSPDPTVSDWGPIAALPVADELHHDHEPSPFVDAQGNLAAFWSSTRDGSWSIWQANIDVAAHRWSPPTAVTGPPFSDRLPLAFDLGDERALVFRSSRSVHYQSKTYQATVTSDRRYSGSPTLRTTNAAQIALRGGYDDVTTYTYDAGLPGGPTEADWYAPDTVGIYLETSAADRAAIATGRDRLRRALPEFLSATNRAVLIVPARDREAVDTDG